MKFHAIVGNPPYQIMDGGAQASATPIYNKFLDAAKSMKPEYISMIMPSRWMTGGKGLDSFRKSMICDRSISILYDHAKAADCFEQVEIKGGICYFLRDAHYFGKTEVHYIMDGKDYVSKRYMDEEGDNIYIRNGRLVSIKEKCNPAGTVSFDTIVSSMKPYGLRGDFFKNPSKYNLPNIRTEKFDNCLTIIGLNEKMQRTYRYINKDYPLPKTEMLYKYKIFIARNYGTGTIGEKPSAPIIAEPGTLCTETFVQIGPFDTRTEAENCLAYMQTKLFRLLVGIRKQDQGAGKEVYHYVPMQDFNFAVTDKQLYKKYKLNDDEIHYINELIR